MTVGLYLGTELEVAPSSSACAEVEVAAPCPGRLRSERELKFRCPRAANVEVVAESHAANVAPHAASAEVGRWHGWVWGADSLAVVVTAIGPHRHPQ